MKNLILVLTLLLGMTTMAVAADVQLMTKEELKPLLGTAGLAVLDVRTGRDWSSSEFKIKGAVRAVSSKFDSWSKSYPNDTRLVLYCA